MASQLAAVAGGAAAAVAGLPLPATLLPNLPNQQQLTRHARRVYVGGLPAGMSEVALTQFFNNAMAIAGATTQSGPPIISCYMNHEKKFAFLEFRSVEETSNALAFDGLPCQGETLKVRRPHDYNPEAARLLGAPTGPSPKINLGLLGVVNTVVEDGPHKVFIGGIPGYLQEEQVRQILQAFGALKAFNLVADRDTGASKGYAFCEYADPSITDTAIQGLSVLSIAGKPLTVRRANVATAAGGPVPLSATASVDPASAALQSLAASTVAALNAATAAASGGGTSVASPPAGAPSAAAAAAAASTPVAAAVTDTVVRLSNMVSRDELLDDGEYGDLVEDITEEVQKYGKLVGVKIPRPDPAGGADPPGVGLVFLCYEEPKGADRARVALNGRKFGENVAEASFYDRSKYDTDVLA